MLTRLDILLYQLVYILVLLWWVDHARIYSRWMFATDSEPSFVRIWLSDLREITTSIMNEPKIWWTIFEIDSFCIAFSPDVFVMSVGICLHCKSSEISSLVLCFVKNTLPFCWPRLSCRVFTSAVKLNILDTSCRAGLTFCWNHIFIRNEYDQMDVRDCGLTLKEKKEKIQSLENYWAWNQSASWLMTKEEQIKVVWLCWI